MGQKAGKQKKPTRNEVGKESDSRAEFTGKQFKMDLEGIRLEDYSCT